MPHDVLEDTTHTLRQSHKDKSKYHSTLLKNYQAEYKKYEERIEKIYVKKMRN